MPQALRKGAEPTRGLTGILLQLCSRRNTKVPFPCVSTAVKLWPHWYSLKLSFHVGTWGQNNESGEPQAEWRCTFEFNLGRKLVSCFPLLQALVPDTLLSCALQFLATRSLALFHDVSGRLPLPPAAPPSPPVAITCSFQRSSGAFLSVYVMECQAHFSCSMALS